MKYRISAGVAAVLLVAASVFVGAVPAQAALIGPPTITSSGGNTVDQTPLILGTIDNPNAADITVEVLVSNSGGTSSYCVTTVPYSSDTVAALWGCSGAAALPYGSQAFSAVAWEDVTPGMTSGSSNTALYTIGGTQPAVLSAPTPGAVTTDATPTFSGTGPSLGLIDVNNGAGTTLCTTPVDEFGAWSCTASPLTAAVYTVQADPTWIDGAPDPGTVPQSLEITLPPAPTVDQTFAPWVTSGTTADVQGNKDADVDYLQVYTSPDGVTWTAYCQATGIIGATIWFCDPPFGSLAMGTSYVAAIARNEAGNFSATGPSITIERVPPPTITAPTDGAFTNDPTPVFSGTTTTGTTADVGEGEGWYCSAPVIAGAFSCESDFVLEDGTYEYSVNIYPGTWVFSETRTFTVDTVVAAPVITGPGTTSFSTRPVISGTAEPFSTITVYRDGAPAACQEGTVVANSTGAWSCSSTATLGAGNTFGFGAVQTDRAGNMSDSGVPPNQLSLTILAPIVTPPTSPTPVATPSPSPTGPLLQAWTFTFGVAGDEFGPGDTTLVTGNGLPPGAAVDIEFHSIPVKLGSTVVKADGTFSKLVTIPEDATAGEHNFVVIITPVEGPPSTQQQPVTVTLPTKAIAETNNGAGLKVGATDDLAGVDRDDPAAPSALTGSIATLGSILSNPIAIGTAALAGLALLLLVAFPAELLNSTISEQYPRFSRRVPKAPWLTRFTDWLETTPLFGGIAITLVAAVIFSFADPGAGLDITTLRVVLAAGIALFIVGYLSSSLAGYIIRRRWNLATTMELKPLGLVLTVVGVVLSRLLEFSPGFLIGLLLGIAVVGQTTAAQRAKATLVQAGVVFVLAVLGWVGYSVLVATGAGGDFGSALALDTMVAITAEGLTALFIGMLPFRFLDGASIFEHSKVVWAAAYAVAAAAFTLIIVPSAWGEPSGSLWLWIVILGAFALVAVGIYLYFRFWAPPLDADEDAEKESEPASV